MVVTTIGALSSTITVNIALCRPITNVRQYCRKKNPSQQEQPKRFPKKYLPFAILFASKFKFVN